MQIFKIVILYMSVASMYYSRECGKCPCRCAHTHRLTPGTFLCHYAPCLLKESLTESGAHQSSWADLMPLPSAEITGMCCGMPVEQAL